MPQDFIEKARLALERALGLDVFGERFSAETFGFTPGPGAFGDPAAYEIPQSVLDALITLDVPEFTGPRAYALTQDETFLWKRLERHVTVLAEEIGIRNTDFFKSLNAAADYVESEFRALGIDTNVQEYRTEADGFLSRNIEAVIPGLGTNACLVIGAHYDTVDCAGANDNGSGVAGLLEIARHAAESPEPSMTLRFVAFTNEEPPYFSSDDMGSRVYVQALRERAVETVGMICLETIGYFSDEPGSQQIPRALKRVIDHDRGDFLALVSNKASRAFLKSVVEAYRAFAEVPALGLAASSLVPGIDYSDHDSFHRAGIPAVMATDTAFMRYPHYHRPSDTPDKLDRVRFAKVVGALQSAVVRFAR